MDREWMRDLIWGGLRVAVCAVAYALAWTSGPLPAVDQNPPSTANAEPPAEAVVTPPLVEA